MVNTLGTIWAASALAVTFGWSPVDPSPADPAPGEAGPSSVAYEYEVRLDAQDLEALRGGRAGELTSVLPAGVGPIDRVRIVVGEGPAERTLHPVDAESPKRLAAAARSRTVRTAAKPVVPDAHRNASDAQRAATDTRGPDLSWPDAAVTFAEPGDPRTTDAARRRTAFQNPQLFDTRGLNEGFQQGVQPLAEASDWVAEQGRAVVGGVDGALRRAGDGLNTAAENTLRAADDALSGRGLQRTPYGGRPGQPATRVPTPEYSGGGVAGSPSGAAPNRSAWDTSGVRPTDRSVTPAVGEGFRDGGFDEGGRRDGAFRDGAGGPRLPSDAGRGLNYGDAEYREDAFSRQPPSSRAGDGSRFTRQFTDSTARPPRDDVEQERTRSRLSPVRRDSPSDRRDDWRRDDLLRSQYDRNLDRRDGFSGSGLSDEEFFQEQAYRDRLAERERRETSRERDDAWVDEWDRRRSSSVGRDRDYSPQSVGDDWNGWDRTAAAGDPPPVRGVSDTRDDRPVGGGSAPGGETGWGDRAGDAPAYNRLGDDGRNADSRRDDRDQSVVTTLMIAVLAAATMFIATAYIDVRNKYRAALRSLPGSVQQSLAA